MDDKVARHGTGLILDPRDREIAVLRYKVRALEDEVKVLREKTDNDYLYFRQRLDALEGD